MNDEQFTARLAAINGGEEFVSTLVWLVPLVIAIASAVSWVFQERLKGRLMREVETHKTALSENLQRTLGKEESQRRYEDEARRRLYQTIGPLRFQLLLACRDAIGRIERFATVERYAVDLQSYFGRSTLYRILRPIAICDLIEDSIAVADFSVDVDAVDCLRLRRAFQKAISGDEPIGSLPGADWTKQVEHVFADRISAAASALIKDRETRKLLRYDEFEALLEAQGMGIVAPFEALLSGFEPETKPLLWTRLVAFALSADHYLRRHGQSSGFDYEPLNVRNLLAKSGVSNISARLDELSAAAEAVSQTGV